MRVSRERAAQDPQPRWPRSSSGSVRSLRSRPRGRDRRRCRRSDRCSSPRRPQPRGDHDRREVRGEVEEHVERRPRASSRVWTTGMSGCATASTSAAPMPGYWKTNSTITTPPAIHASCSAVTWMAGTIAFGTAWRQITCRSGRPFEPRHRHVLALEHLDHRAAHDAADVRHDREDQRRRRQHHHLRVLPRLLARRRAARPPGTSGTGRSRRRGSGADADHELGQRREDERDGRGRRGRRACRASSPSRRRSRSTAGSR